MSEEEGQGRGFTVTDRRQSKRDEEESAEEAPRPERAEAEPEPAAPPEAEAGEAPPGGVPQPDFGGFILSLANTALINLGVAPDPAGGHPESNIEGGGPAAPVSGA